MEFASAEVRWLHLETTLFSHLALYNLLRYTNYSATLKSEKRVTAYLFTTYAARKVELRGAP